MNLAYRDWVDGRRFANFIAVIENPSRSEIQAAIAEAKDFMAEVYADWKQVKRNHLISAKRNKLCISWRFVFEYAPLPPGGRLKLVKAKLFN